MGLRATANGRYLVLTASNLNFAWTACLWFRVASVAGGFRTIMSQDVNNPFYSQLFSFGDSVGLTYNAGGDLTVASGISINTWYFVCVVYSATTTRTFFGTGASALSKVSGGAALEPPGDDMYLMDEFAHDQTLNGDMAAFKLWQAELTDAQVEAEYRQTSPKRTDSLLAFLPMFETTGAGKNLAGGPDFTSAGALANTDSPPIPWSARRERYIVTSGVLPPTYDIIPPTIVRSFLD